MSSSSSATACTWASSAAYGNGWIETPHLDRLAAEGVVFDHHFPENLTTLPTRRSWWTGRYGFPDPEQGWTPLRPDEPILPDLLWNQGVRTALISDVPLLREAGQGFGRGFDEVVWVRGQGYDPLVPPGDPRAGRVRLERRAGPAAPARGRPRPRALERALGAVPPQPGRLADRRRGEHRGRPDGPARPSTGSTAGGASRSPFLLWLDLFSPHGPWDPPEPYRDQYAAAEPDEFEAGEEGDLVEEEDEEEIDLEEVAGPDRRPRRRRRRRARRGRAAPAPPDLRRDGHAASTAGSASCSTP